MHTSFRNLLLIICLCLGTPGAYGQVKQIHGNVIDPDSLPVSDVSVVMQLLDSTYVATAITDEQGEFRMDYPGTGYRLIFSHLNYNTCVVERESPQAGTVRLTPGSNQLKTVTVTAERPLVKMEDGHLSYDMKQLMGDRVFDSAFDLLKAIPLVSGDENSLNIAGSMSGTSILINGRPSNLSLSQLYTYLKSLPPEKLEKAELTYNAPPQWHVRGAAINVIIRKSERYEVQGQVQGRWKHQHVNSYTGIGSLFVSNKTYNYDVIYNYGNSRFASQINTDGRHTVGEDVYDIHTVGHYRNRSQSHNLFGNFAYNIPGNHQLGVSYNGQFSPKTDNRKFTESNLFSDARSGDTGHSQLHDVRATYDAPFGLRVSGEYTYYDSRMQQDMQYFPKNGAEENAFQYDRGQRIHQYLATADMSHKLPEGWRLNYGGQYRHTQTRNRQYYDDRLNSGAESFRNRTDMSEDQASVYVGTSRSFAGGKVYAEASVEGEYYRIQDEKEYNLIPNLSIVYRPHDKHAMQLIYQTYRGYPSYWDRQDYTLREDEYTIRKGNPALTPTRVNQAFLVYVFNNKYVLQMSYTKTRNYYMTQSYQSPDELQMIYQTMNTDYTSSFSLMLSAPVKLGKRFTSNLTAMLYSERYKSSHWYDLSFNRQKWTGFFQMNNWLTVSKKPYISLNINAYYKTPSLQGLWDLSNIWSMDASLRWRFAKEKATLSVGCYDILEKAYPNYKVRYATQWQDMNERKFKRSFVVSFTYRFNNYKEKQQRSVNTSRFGTD